MFTTRSQRSGCFGIVIVLGVILGAIYVWLDQTPSVLDFAVSTRAAESPATINPSLVFVSPEPTSEASVRRPVQLLIPRARVIAPVVRLHLAQGSWDVSQLGSNVGHLEGTAWLGQTGNIVLAGHVEMADGAPGTFAHLADLQVGDELLLVEENSDSLVYAVSSVRDVQPTDLSVLYSSDINLLTLITCSDYDLLSNSYQLRVVVQAVRIR